MNELKHILQSEFIQPSPEFVKLFAKQVYPSVVTAKVLEQFTNLTKKAIQNYINDIITERLKTALSKENESLKEEKKQEETENNAPKVVTTEEEIEGLMIVKTILRQSINANRITYRDNQSYFTILLDDNNRKTICRLYLNTAKKYFVTLDEQKKEIKNELNSLDDIFEYTDLLLETVNNLEK
jgi:hypothetical protein